MVHLSYGDVTADHYIREIGSDLAIHGWDVGQSEMCNLMISEDLAQAVYDFYEPRTKELADSRMFGPATITAPDDSVQVRLLGLCGRKAHIFV